jgi:hypothetical protein
LVTAGPVASPLVSAPHGRLARTGTDQPADPPAPRAHLGQHQGRRVVTVAATASSRATAARHTVTASTPKPEVARRAIRRGGLVDVAADYGDHPKPGNSSSEQIAQVVAVGRRGRQGGVLRRPLWRP